MVRRPDRRLAIPLAILLLSASGCSKRLPTSSDGASARAGPSILSATGARAKGDGLTWFNAEASGTVRQLPEMNIFERAQVGSPVQAAYFRTTDLNREFRRGFVEFTVPRFAEMSSARIFLRGGGGSSSNPLPPDRFELSSYEDVDGVVNTSDYDRPTSPLGTFEADINVEDESFAFDVSSLVTRSLGSRLGFRIKLEADPTYVGMGFLGDDFAVRIEVTTTPAEATEYLQTVIRTLVLRPEVEAGLLAPLREVLAVLRDGNPDNDDVACGKIQEFLDEVTAQAQSGERIPTLDLLARGRNIMTCHSGHADIRVFRDFPSFEAATARLVEIDFEDQPVSGSSDCPPPNPNPFCTPIPNPLVLERVSFGDPYSLNTGFCSSPTCSPDPDNPNGGNIVLGLRGGSTIAFPANTDAAMLVLEGMGDHAFGIKVTDSAGDTTLVNGAGVPYGVAYLGVVSPNRISRIDIVGDGPIAVSALYFGIAQKRTLQRHPASAPRS